MGKIKEFLVSKNLFEFLRYVVVGGISALIDMGALYLLTELVFDGQKSGIPLTISVAGGFIVGLVANYLLSQLFVFTSDTQREKGKKAGAFLIYALVGLVGFGLALVAQRLGLGGAGASGKDADYHQQNEKKGKCFFHCFSPFHSTGMQSKYSIRKRKKQRFFTFP